MSTQSGSGIGSRRESRETALGLLYAAEARDADPEELLSIQLVAPDNYSSSLIKGVAEHREDIDALITRYSDGWNTDRMPAVDRALIRIAVFELKHLLEVPTTAILSEAVELASSYSTERSSRFVNGVLSKIAEELRPSQESRSGAGD